MKPLAFLLFFVFILVALLWAPSCANIIPPSGGPRDSIPPVLIRVSPADSTVNFRSDRIVFEFDELVDLQDVQNNVLFTPTFERNPEIGVKGRTITVRFRDSLEPNTTYTLSFGNSIRDINEGNTLRGFSYSFSTGPAMDSLEIRGRVILAQTGGLDTTLTILLHRDLEDSAVRLKRPPYVTRLNSNGEFRFGNLPEGPFAIYALGNAGLVRRYQNDNQLFAFHDDPVYPGRDTSILLYAYRETPGTPAGPGFSLPRPGAVASRERLSYTSNLTAGLQDLSSPYTLTFSSPLRNVDTGRISLTVDSLFTQVNYRIQLDTSSKIVSIQTNWQEGKKYNLVLDRDFAEDTLGRKLLKTDTLFFSTRKASDYGVVQVRVRNIDTAANPVLLFVQNDRVVFSEKLVNGTFRSPRFLPGEYELRILYDRNNNGIWDPGKFFIEKRQPEIIKPIERRVTVRPNWDNEFEVSL